MPDSPQYYKELELYTQLRAEGMGFSTIRKELTRKGMSEDDIKEIIMTIDDTEQAIMLIKHNNSMASSLLWSGYLLVLFTLVTSIGVYLYSSGTYILLTGGAFSLGVGFIIAGKNKRIK